MDKRKLIEALRFCLQGINRLIEAGLKYVTVAKTKKEGDIKELVRKKLDRKDSIGKRNYYLGVASSMISMVSSSYYRHGILIKVDSPPNKYKILIERKIPIESFIRAYFQFP